jgi:tetrapyrrole methylase family protein / MazG family protein
MSDASVSFERLYEIVKRLRAPDGCPWDREQSPSTLRGDLIEETYETVEAIDQKDPAHVREELGDVFLLVTMIAYMHEQEGAFSVSDSLEEVSDKLIRRHPHVFGESDAKTPEEVLTQWAKIKVEQEGRKPKDSILDEVSRSLPPLERANKLQKKAAKVGFDWPSIDGVWGKIEEELGEAKAACAAKAAIASDGADGAESAAAETAHAELEGELGDLLFSVVNVCRYLKVDPSVALHGANVKFYDRFRHVEKRMKENGEAMEKGKLEVMDGYWDEAKAIERSGK